MFYHFRSRLSSVTWVLLPSIMALTGQAQVDPGCPRGMHLNDRTGKCDQCVNGFTDQDFHWETACHPCMVCDSGKEQMSSCNAKHNTVCKCPRGQDESPEGMCIMSPVIHAPERLLAISRSTRTLTLTWQRPQGIESSSLLSYEIHVNSTQLLLHISVVPPKETYVIEGLLPGTLYSISLTLHTSMGESPHSNVVHERTQDAVIHAPELLHAIARSTRNLTLTWQRPQGIDSSSLLSYEIYVNSSTQQLLNMSVVQPKEAYVLEGLVPDTLYSISLTLRTRMGESPHSNVVHERTQEAVGTTASTSVDCSIFIPIAILVFVVFMAIFIVLCIAIWKIDKRNRQTLTLEENDSVGQPLKSVVVTVNKKRKGSIPIGSQLILDCQVDCSPDPVYLWTRFCNGRICNINGLPKFIGKQLKIENIEGKYCGLYVCCTQHGNGSSFGCVKVTRKGRGNRIEWKPLVLQLTATGVLHPNSFNSFRLGTNLNIACFTPKGTTFQIKWRKYDVHQQTNQWLCQDELGLVPVSKKDLGWYTCLVAFKEQPILSCHFQLTTRVSSLIWWLPELVFCNRWGGDEVGPELVVKCDAVVSVRRSNGQQGRSLSSSSTPVQSNEEEDLHKQVEVQLQVDLCCVHREVLPSTSAELGREATGNGTVTATGGGATGDGAVTTAGGGATGDRAVTAAGGGATGYGAAAAAGGGATVEDDHDEEELFLPISCGHPAARRPTVRPNVPKAGHDNTIGIESAGNPVAQHLQKNARNDIQQPDGQT